MRAKKQDDVLDVIYDSWYGLPLDEADKAVWDYAHRKLIPIEWLKNKVKEALDEHRIDDALYLKECIAEWEKIILDLPSAQPERKKGKWVNGTCNQCGSHAPYWAMASTYYESNFCPNCGADMRGEKENEANTD